MSQVKSSTPPNPYGTHSQPPPYPGSGRWTSSYPQPLSVPTQNSQYTNHRFGAPQQPGWNPRNGHEGQDMNDIILANHAVTAAISLNGRNPVNVVCPNCRNFTRTVITEVENKTVKKFSSIYYVYFIGIALVFGGMFTAMAYLTKTYYPFYILPVFLLFLLIGFIVRCRAIKVEAEIFQDVHHHCSVCRTLLGVNSGI